MLPGRIGRALWSRYSVKKAVDSRQRKQVPEQDVQSEKRFICSVHFYFYHFGLYFMLNKNQPEFGRENMHFALKKRQILLKNR